MEPIRSGVRPERFADGKRVAAKAISIGWNPTLLIPSNLTELNQSAESLQGQRPAFAQGCRRLFQWAQRRRRAGILNRWAERSGGVQRAGPFRQGLIPLHPANQQGRWGLGLRGDERHPFASGGRVGNGPVVIPAPSPQGEDCLLYTSRCV